VANDNKYKEILEKLETGIREAMNSDKYKEFLRVQSKFYNYSFNNTMLIYMQRPDATYVAGIKTWNKLGRSVNAGEKGIKILAPIPYNYEKFIEKIDPITNKPVIDENTGEVVKEKVTVTGIKFKVVSVFDIKQTSGKELPEICKELEGNSVNAEAVIRAIKYISDVPIEFKNIDSGAKGYFIRSDDNKGKIVIKDGMSLDQTAKTLIHEYAHSQLHNSDNLILDRSTREVQAESIAFIVADRFGIDTSEYSFEYLASWSSDKELSELKSSFDIIQKTASKIIQAIEDSLSNELLRSKVINMNKNIDAPTQFVQSQMTNVQNSVTDGLNIKNKIIQEYIKEFPAIKYISENIAKAIEELNQKHNKILSINDIRELHIRAGKNLEISNNTEIRNEFENLQFITDEFKKALLAEKTSQAATNLSKSLDMELVR